MEDLNRGTAEMEKTWETSGQYIGRLKDLGLGNPDGIPSRFAQYTNEQLQDVAEQDARSLVAPTDLSCRDCIDGRRKLHNADGSTAETRLRRVGGSASDLGVALNAEASIIETIDAEAPLADILVQIERIMGDPSAHEGGCGGANGEVSDHESIHQSPTILNVVKTIMQIPSVRDYFGVDFDDELGERVRVNAGTTAAFLRSKGWSGQAYVDRTKQINPKGVAILDVDETDSKFSGHKEDVLKIIIGDKTSDKPDEFVWNLKATKEAAEKLAGQRGTEGYTQAIIADAAKHVAVANRLPSTETPIVLLSA